MKNHEELYDKFMQNEGKKEKPKCSSSQPTINSMFKMNHQIKVNITQKQLIDACVELVTVNGRPYSVLNDSGFQKVINPMLCGFQKKVTLNSTSIR